MEQFQQQSGSFKKNNQTTLLQNASYGRGLWELSKEIRHVGLHSLKLADRDGNETCISQIWGNCSEHRTAYLFKVGGITSFLVNLSFIIICYIKIFVLEFVHIFWMTNTVFPANTGFIRQCATLVSVLYEFDFLVTNGHLKYLVGTNPFVYTCLTI